jgi:hypothetical protein
VQGGRGGAAEALCARPATAQPARSRQPSGLALRAPRDPAPPHLIADSHLLRASFVFSSLGFCWWVPCIWFSSLARSCAARGPRSDGRPCKGVAYCLRYSACINVTSRNIQACNAPLLMIRLTRDAKSTFRTGPQCRGLTVVLEVVLAAQQLWQQNKHVLVAVSVDKENVLGAFVVHAVLTSTMVR